MNHIYFKTRLGRSNLATEEAYLACLSIVLYYFLVSPEGSARITYFCPLCFMHINWEILCSIGELEDSQRSILGYKLKNVKDLLRLL